MKKLLIAFLAILFFSFLFVALSGCQSDYSDVAKNVKDEQYTQAVFAELKSCFDANLIEIIDSSLSKGLMDITEGEHYVFVFKNDEDNEKFRIKVEDYLQDIYGENWKEQVQTEVESNAKEGSKDLIESYPWRIDNGWWYTVAAGHAWASTQPYRTTATYTGAGVNLHYKFNGPWQNHEGYQAKYKSNNNVIVSSDIWTVGFPADCVSALGSYHTISGGVYNGVPDRTLGNF